MRAIFGRLGLAVFACSSIIGCAVSTAEDVSSSSEAVVAAPADAHMTASGRYSFDQPPSAGPNGYEGRCGQTSVANMVTAWSGQTRFVSPVQIIDLPACIDPAPGTLPSTYVACINGIAGAGTYAPCGAVAPTAPVTWLGTEVARGPVAVMISAGSFGLHWVTVVTVDPAAVNDDGSTCAVTYLEYGRQTTVSCASFDGVWSLNSVAGAAVANAGAFSVPPYTAICNRGVPNPNAGQPAAAPLAGVGAVTVGCFAGDLPSDVWARCWTAIGPSVAATSTFWGDTTCTYVKNNPSSYPASSYAYQYCGGLVRDCIGSTNAVCANLPAAAGPAPGGAPPVIPVAVAAPIAN